MQYFAGTREFQIKEPTAVTIGKFDGLHRGHQKLLREVMRYREKGYKPAVFTFETAPGTLIRGKLQTMIGYDRWSGDGRNSSHRTRGRRG